MFVVFLKKHLVDLSMFALKCEHARFHSLTEMSPDRNGQTEKSRTRKCRASPARGNVVPMWLRCQIYFNFDCNELRLQSYR